MKKPAESGSLDLGRDQKVISAATPSPREAFSATPEAIATQRAFHASVRFKALAYE
jgi:hypothetical protein